MKIQLIGIKIMRTWLQILPVFIYKRLARKIAPIVDLKGHGKFYEAAYRDVYIMMKPDDKYLEKVKPWKLKTN